MPLVDIQNLTVTYGRKVALKNINLTINPDEYLVILGPTGAGKTTLLRTITGLKKPKVGKILIDGQEVTKTRPEERGMAYLPQTYSLFPYMNVKDNVLFSPKVRRSKTEEEMSVLAGEVLDMVGLRDRWDAYPMELSGGMMQRCALARAIATDLKIFLLDEPLKALDARLRLQLRTELRKLVKDLGITCLHVTHDQEEALALADRILILNEGQIVQHGDPKILYQDPQTYFTADFLGESNSFTGEVIASDQDRLQVKIDTNDKVLISRPLNTNNQDIIGKKVILTVKSEATKVYPNSQSVANENSNIFRGEVIHHYYLGKYTNLEIKVNEISKSLLAKISSFEYEKYPLKSKVKLRIASSDLLSFLWRS
ncbi:MAG: ABC transporter ATP-binding protein [Candidatus Heimdallarchaeota archaeon]|nr:MAG: ABC transporter ATP-binding protein [Candidatus Heimdallarchaeota archaeon]